ncbi:MAG: Asp-tRNA(Asn)/Glu-tRNA(Gln) amidotransferase GatCAB subunit A [Candidatus Colwellbacteria bacterium CG10_big_fil_rev_8_21_14_0_10_41_28]|uniref:Glutamyl-tRNA(Gln) amidotransferase subunit A n=1 Tax=Candidatus Colwellbacteria bacterium CG10_big_fil_rev_8_21_14_0_10_41_28 TaxID=1974539 RepID=A0A2H0VJN9_9BACT|nr:MAG: Asp-tRNA(Asn)/Glu-tRNA(Gln) amidotransferase GatCAB subunit A [Candidatus Colwellbacteria bacterium CG10_big_fil_rev_8_21_14_0_10_41_28]
MKYLKKQKSLSEISDSLKRGTLKVSELTKEHLNRIEEIDEQIGAFLNVDKNGALAYADQLDKEIESGLEVGPLTGAQVSLKDAILLRGLPSTAGSKILRDYVASYDATVSERLKEQKVVFLGKNNMDEFAMGSSNENSAYKLVKNPHDIERIPGGSSGGSAAAVASGMVTFALGSDTGGSIRQPAAMCGVVGLKTTYGSVPRYGLMAMASSLDQIGPITTSVKDAALVFRAIAGHTDKDGTSYPNLGYSEDISILNEEKTKKLKIGVPKEYFGEGISDEIKESVNTVIDFYRKEGFEIKEVSLPSTKYALPVYYIVMPAEASTNLARYDGLRYGTRGGEEDVLVTYMRNRGEGFGPEVKRRIALGTFVLSAGYYDAYYLRAQKVRAVISQEFEKVFEDVDVLITPTTPTTAFKIGEKSGNPLEMYMSDILTIPANLAGIPAISIPVKGREDKLPIGFQIMGKHFREEDILSLGMYYER